MPRLFRHVLLFAVAAIVLIGGSDKANAACVSSSGSQVIRPVFSDGSSVMYCPDGDNWSTLLSAGAGVPAGSNGYVQFNNAGVFGGDAGLFWDNTNKRLGIGTGSPSQKLQVGNGSEFTVVRIVGDTSEYGTGLQLWNDNATAGASIFLDFLLGASDNARAAIHGRSISDGSVDLFFQASNTSGTRSDMLSIDGSTGNVGIGTATPAYTLSVGGNLATDVAGPYGGGLILKRGTGDNATLAVHNHRIESWFGIGFGSSCGTGAGCPDNTNAKLVMDVRTGDFTIAGVPYKPGGGSWTASSDSRLKDIDGPYQRGLDSIVQLNTVLFHYKKGNARKEPFDRQYVGLVAQDVQKIIPEAVSERGDGYLDLDTTPINYAIINALKELKAENDNLRAEFEAYKSANP